MLPSQDKPVKVELATDDSEMLSSIGCFYLIFVLSTLLYTTQVYTACLWSE